MPKYRNITIFLDPETYLQMRTNGLWVIRRNNGNSHEGIWGRTVREGHVIARGRAAGASTLRVTRSDLSLKQLRDLAEESGAIYDLKFIGKSSRAGRS